MRKFGAFLFLYFLSSIVWSCNNNQSVKLPGNYRDSFFSFIQKGNEVYANKAGLQSFVESLKYYDKAQEIADRSDDTSLLAEAVFAKGRVYDAWNKEPQNTILYFKKAAALFALKPETYKRYLYAKHLVAHAYDKINDSLNTVIILKELYDEINHQDTILKKQVPFTAEMALISTEVHNYKLAESILNDLTQRSWIKNDPGTYNYLDHYYLTQGRLDVYYRHIHSAFIDSLQQLLNNSANIMDRMYYAGNLTQLYAHLQNYEMAYRMLEREKKYSDSINNNAGISSMESALLKSELQGEKRKLEYQATLKQTWIKVIWLLSILLGVITFLSIYLQKQKKKYLQQTKEVAAANKKLDEKIQQVEVLNKEIQHRVKNNLHMVFSLLQMQQRRTEHKETVINLQAAMLRIESIASLHNELVATNENPDLTKHIKELVSSAVDCLSSDKKVVTHINVETAYMLPKYYLPLSLIINEWITNSVKYAVTKNGLLELDIQIKNMSDHISVMYNDNGIVQQKKPEGLGTQIVNMLCRQLSADLKIDGNNPYQYELSIAYEK